MRQNASGVCEGHPGALHDMRVASRRLRAALTAFAPYLNATTATALEARAKAVTKGLGRPREVDVLIEMLEEWRRDYHPPWNFAAGHAAGVLRTEREALQAQCAETAAGVDEIGLGGVVSKDAAPCLAEHMAARLREELAAARSAYKHWRKTGEGKDLHKLRKTLKQLRYTSEHFTPHYGKKLDRFIKALKAVQDDLGEWHDRRVLCKTLDALEAGAPYRAAQGFPELVRDAEEESEAAIGSVRKSARKLFCKDARKKAQKVFDAPKLECCAAHGDKKE